MKLSFLIHSSIDGYWLLWIIFKLIWEFRYLLCDNMKFVMPFLNFISYGYAPGHVMAGSCVSPIFNYSDDPPYFYCFPSSYPDLLSHQQCKGALLSLHLYHHLLCIVFLIISIIFSIIWMFIVVLNCIFFMTSIFLQAHWLFRFVLRNIDADDRLVLKFAFCLWIKIWALSSSCHHTFVLTSWTLTLWNRKPS